MSKRTRLALVAGIAVVMLVAVLAGSALAQTGTATPGAMMSGTSTPDSMMGGSSTPGSMMGGTAMPGGMMGGNSGMMGSSTTATGTVPFGMSGMGDTDDMMSGMMGMMMTMMGNMMGGNGNGVMGMIGGMQGMSGGMMGMSGGWSDPSAKPLTLDQAQAAAQKYVTGLPNNAGANLVTMEVMEFANHFYVAVGDKSANQGAFALLVDRYNGNVTLEPGPNIMWNTKYGMMSGQGSSGGQAGMMGMMGLWTPPNATPTITEEQARANAQAFLAIKFPNATLAPTVTTFRGFYGLNFLVNGQFAGMLSVNAFSGQVWYHTWHGQFLGQRTA